MPIVRVSSFAVSLDGYAAGPNQSLENPLGNLLGLSVLKAVRQTRCDATGPLTVLNEKLDLPRETY